mgnify:CR=1 FL=1
MVQRKSTGARSRTFALVDTGLAKLMELRVELISRLFEREEVVETGINALVSRHHHLQLGPHGTGKTMLSRAIAEAIQGAVYLRKLLTRTMTMDELFGPPSFKGFQNDQYRRAVEGFIPTCHILTLEEFFKCSDSILNGLLEVMNERTFTNGIEMINIPLMAIFTSSNELYESDSLLPLYSRITFRHVVPYLKEKDNFLKMVDDSVNRRQPDTARIGLTVQELTAVQDTVWSVTLNGDAGEILWTIRTGLATEGIIMDDRKAAWLAETVVRPQALLAGRSVVEADDFSILTHCLWDQPKDRQAVASVILKITNPMLEVANKAVDTVQRLYEEAAQFERATPNDTTNAVFKKWSDAAGLGRTEIMALRKKVKEVSGNSKETLETALKKCRAIQERILSEGIGAAPRETEEDSDESE